MKKDTTTAEGSGKPVDKEFLKPGPLMLNPPDPHYVGPAGSDPWAHRSTGMRCASCMWFVEKVHDKAFGSTLNDNRAAIELNPERVRLGRCRRHAPTMNGYPACFATDWCGDHKLDENKI